MGIAFFAYKSHFGNVFRAFLSESASDVQTIIEPQNHPQIGPETALFMYRKFEYFLKIDFFGFFLTIFLWER